eukprot:gb/GEZN01014912.1/.p1 GENE.gb/GEZN01014912.1/~~gb/GEZN01014912.1/.p1  ORF type:complete len:282 (-),score=33.15 gb/GEZN01014912.1/:30-875(-)
MNAAPTPAPFDIKCSTIVGQLGFASFSLATLLFWIPANTFCVVAGLILSIFGIGVPLFNAGARMNLHLAVTVCTRANSMMNTGTPPLIMPDLRYYSVLREFFYHLTSLRYYAIQVFIWLHFGVILAILPMTIIQCILLPFALCFFPVTWILVKMELLLVQGCGDEDGFQELPMPGNANHGGIPIAHPIHLPHSGLVGGYGGAAEPAHANGQRPAPLPSAPLPSAPDEVALKSYQIAGGDVLAEAEPDLEPGAPLQREGVIYHDPTVLGSEGWKEGKGDTDL